MASAPGEVYIEWETAGQNHKGTNMKAEVTVHEDVSAFVPSSAVAASAVSTSSNSSFPVQEQPVIIVRAEEVLLVVLVLMIWVAAIALFFNRWGKIRMLEPYQPKFQQAHRPSCPIAVDTGVNTGCSISDLRKQRMSFSKFNVNCLGDPLYSGLPSPRQAQRPRQNSVFVGSPTMAFMNPPRRAKSAMDIQHLILGEYNQPKPLSGFSSMLPMKIENSPSKELLSKDRKPSITVEPSSPIPPAAVVRRRPSTCHEFSCYFPNARRRPSCFSDYKKTHTYSRYKFKSFDQPSCSWERRRSTALINERSPTKSRNRPSMSLERPLSWDRRPSVTVEPPPTTEEEETESNNSNRDSIKSPRIKSPLKKQATINFENINPPRIAFNKTSRSLDQPQPYRMNYDRRPSFTLEQPSTNNRVGNNRLSVSLDQSASRWDGTTPTFLIERPTPSSPNQPSHISPGIELQQLMETETESKQVTNV